MILYHSNRTIWTMHKFKLSKFFPMTVVFTFSTISFSHLADLVSFSQRRYLFTFSGPSFFTFSVDFSYLAEFSHLA